MTTGNRAVRCPSARNIRVVPPAEIGGDRGRDAGSGRTARRHTDPPTDPPTDQTTDPHRPAAPTRHTDSPPGRGPGPAGPEPARPPDATAGPAARPDHSPTAPRPCARPRHGETNDQTR